MFNVKHEQQAEVEKVCVQELFIIDFFSFIDSFSYYLF